MARGHSPMTNSRVTGVRSIELGVRDLHQSAEFYTKVWALEEVSADGDSIHFRATGGEPPTPANRPAPPAMPLSVRLFPVGPGAVDQLFATSSDHWLSRPRA